MIEVLIHTADGELKPAEPKLVPRVLMRVKMKWYSDRQIIPAGTVGTIMEIDKDTKVVTVWWNVDRHNVNRKMFYGIGALNECCVEISEEEYAIRFRYRDDI